GPDGNVWFTEQQGKIGKATPAGVIKEFSVPTGGSQPTALAVGPDGALWFTEQGSNKIGRITTAGTITEINAAGNPGIIALGSDGNLWFTELTGNNIARINLTPPAGPSPLL